MSLKSIWGDITRFFLLDVVGKVRWKLKHGLTDQDKAKVHELLRDDYYIILTHRRNHLSTYFTSLGHFLLTGKFGFWSHALMNLEDQVNTVDDFRLVEAVSAGVKYTPFDQVFDVDAVVLLKPRGLTLEQWTTAMDGAKTYLGRRYDTLFDLADENKLSCVELILNSIKKIPGYRLVFSDFLQTIDERGNLTPQMYYDSDDFEVALEIRR